MKKIIILLVVFLFVGMGFQPAYATTDTIFEKKLLRYLKIIGPTEGVVGESYSYTFRLTDPDDDEFLLFIDWDDGFAEDWMGPYSTYENITCYHIWSEPGVYEIKAIARVNGWEDYYATLNVTIIDNNPPNPPEIDGPTRPKVGIEYTWKFWSEDLDGDNVSYYVEWGDGNSSGWSYYVESGEPMCFSHKWEEKIPKYFRVKAKDIYEAESDWSYAWFRDKSSNLGLNNVEDCDCKAEDRPNLFLVKLRLNKVEVLTNILLLKFGYIPEVKENCELVLEGISSIDITRDFEVLCEILYVILAPISNLMFSLFQLISSGIFIGFIALLISIFIVSLGMAVGDLLNCWWV